MAPVANGGLYFGSAPPPATYANMRTFKAALDLLGAMHEAALDKAFARLGVDGLPGLVASSSPRFRSATWRAASRKCSACRPGAERRGPRRLRPAFPRASAGAFPRLPGRPRPAAHQRLGALRAVPPQRAYNDYYRRIRIDHAIALPIYVRDGLLVSFVLNRTRRDHRP